MCKIGLGLNRDLHRMSNDFALDSPHIYGIKVCSAMWVDHVIVSPSAAGNLRCAAIHSPVCLYEWSEWIAPSRVVLAGPVHCVGAMHSHS